MGTSNEGLVGGEIFVTDASIIRAEANKQYSASIAEVEMLLAHLKKILRLDRFRLRGTKGAKDESLLAATAQNLRKLAKLRRTDSNTA